jgi:anaerobic magnesium-protoporphyrin IX monomethyl ester cyclase
MDYLLGYLRNGRFAFSDDTITSHSERIERICGHILNRNYVVEWVCASRVDVVNSSLLRLMARAGCRSIQFGFESGNEDVLRSINKQITPEQILYATKLCVQHQIIPYGNFIIGFPEDTPSTIQDTYNLALRIKIMHGTCDFAIMTPFPGTYFYEHAEELGMKIHTENWNEYLLDNPVISTKHLDIDELKALYIKCRTGLSRMESWN